MAGATSARRSDGALRSTRSSSASSGHDQRPDINRHRPHVPVAHRTQPRPLGSTIVARDHFATALHDGRRVIGHGRDSHWRVHVYSDGTPIPAARVRPRAAGRARIGRSLGRGRRRGLGRIPWSMARASSPRSGAARPCPSSRRTRLVCGRSRQLRAASRRRALCTDGSARLALASGRARTSTLAGLARCSGPCHQGQGGVY